MTEFSYKPATVKLIELIFWSLNNKEAENNQHGPIHQFLRLLVQGVTSFSSLLLTINSTMDSAECLFEELDHHCSVNRLNI